MNQYNPKKPHKCGYKVFVLSSQSGFSFDFDIFAGAQNNVVPEGSPSLSVSSNVVVRLVNSISRNSKYKFFMTTGSLVCPWQYTYINKV